MLNQSFINIWNIENVASLTSCFDEMNESLNLIMKEYREETTWEGSEDTISLQNDANMITPEKAALSELKTPFCKCNF